MFHSCFGIELKLKLKIIKIQVCSYQISKVIFYSYFKALICSSAWQSKKFVFYDWANANYHRIAVQRRINITIIFLDYYDLKIWYNTQN